MLVLKFLGDNHFNLVVYYFRLKWTTKLRKFLNKKNSLPKLF